MLSKRNQEFVLKFKNIEQMIIMERFILTAPIEIESNNLYNLVAGVLNQIAERITTKIDKRKRRGQLTFKDYELNAFVFLLDRLIETKPDMTNPDNVYLREVFSSSGKFVLQKHRDFDTNVNTNVNFNAKKLL